MVGKIIEDENTLCFAFDLLATFDPLKRLEAPQEIPGFYTQKRRQGQCGQQIGNVVPAVQASGSRR